MNKLWASLLALFFWTTLGNEARAQEVFLSKEQKFTFKDGDYSVLGWCGQRLYTYRASKEGYYLDGFNDSMRLMATVALDFFPKKIYETRFIVSGDKILVLFQAIQSNVLVQYAALLDDRAMLLQKPIAIDSVKTAWMASDRKYFDYVISADRSRVMLYRSSNRGSDKKVQFHNVLLDNGLNILSRNAPSLISKERLNIGSTVLGNDGSLFLHVSDGNNDRQFSDGSWLLRLRPGAGDFDTLSMPLERRYLSGALLKLDDAEQKLLMAAFYSNKKSGNTEGLFYATLDASRFELTESKALHFDERMRQSTEDRNKKKAFDDYVVRDIILKNDGGFLAVAESFYITSRSSSFNGGYYGYYSWYGAPYSRTYTTEYNYGDIMVLNYDAQGQMDWSRFVRKYQYSQEDEGIFSSYAQLNSGGSLVFLYNDFTGKKPGLSLVGIDNQGESQFKKWTGGPATKGDWMPRFAKQIGLRELLVPVLQNNSLWFARIAF